MHGSQRLSSPKFASLGLSRDDPDMGQISSFLSNPFTLGASSVI